MIENRQFFDRDDPKSASELMQALCPGMEERRLVLQQLLSSIAQVEAVSSELWALSLFEDGFRLNVGPVEVMTLTRTFNSWPFESSENQPDVLGIRLLLQGDVSDELSEFVASNRNLHALAPMAYKSIPSPHWCYTGSAKLIDGRLRDTDRGEIAQAIRLVEPLHHAYIQHAMLGSFRSDS